jgi:hypothetical protein
LVAVTVVAGASAAGLPPPLFRIPDQATALASAGVRIAAATACDVRVVDGRARPKLLQRFGFCREDRFDSAVLGLWLGRKTIVEEIIISPSPHGEAYQLWSGPIGGTLHQIGGEWGWTDSDEPPTFGCDRMVAAGAGALAITPVVNNAGDGTSCGAHTTTPVLLRGSLNRRLDVPGAWGALATDGKRIALAGFDSEGRRTSQLSVIGIDGRRLSSPRFAATDIQTAYRGWFTPAGLFLDARRGLVGPGSRLLAGGYDDVTIAEGRAVYLRGRFLRVRRLQGGPDRLVLKLRRAGGYVAAGSLGVAVLTGTESSRSALYRVPWRTIDAVLPRR